MHKKWEAALALRSPAHTPADGFAVVWNNCVDNSLHYNARSQESPRWNVPQKQLRSDFFWTGEKFLKVTSSSFILEVQGKKDCSWYDFIKGTSEQNRDYEQ